MDKAPLPAPIIAPLEETPVEEVSKGYLVLRLKTGQGFQIGTEAEVRIGIVNGNPTGKVQIAIRAPRGVRIRRLT